MKQILFFVLTLLPMMASAEAVEIDGIYYYLNSDLKQATVAYKENNYYSGDVIIPEKVTYNTNEYSVTSIDGAFDGCRNLTSVTIPNSVTYIGEATFYDCSRLSSLIIPNSVTSIDYYAFYGCNSLTSVVIPNSLTNIRYAAFRGCSSRLCLYITDLEAWCNIKFDYSLEAHHLFLNGVEIKDLIIPNSVTSIGNNAFSGCAGLTSVTIPNSVTAIGSNVFSGCSGLTSIIIPNSVTSIEGDSFNGCAASVILENGNPKYDSRDNCNAIIETSTNTLIVGFKNTVIPNSVTAIGNSAFSGCSSLTSLTIPNSVTAIGNSAFWGCNELTSIVLENNNPISGNSLFSNETYNKATLIVPVGTKATYQSSEEWGKFQNIIESGEGGIIDQEFVADGIRYKIGENNTVSVIEDKNMKNTTGDIVIPNQVFYNGIEYQVTSIGNSAFEWCDRLTSMTIPNSVNSIGTNAFAGCTLIKIVTEIENPFSIEENVFKGVPSNTKVIVPEGSKAKYLATQGWNRFTNIIEKNSPEGDVDDEDDDFNALGTPLTFEAIEGTVTVNVKNYYCSNTPTIQYRVDNGPWTDFKLTHTECYGAPLYSNFIPAGKIVQLRCNDWPSMLNRLDQGPQADGLSILCDADCYVYGNVMSLETYYYPSEYDQECSLSWLFYLNTHIKNHPTKALVLPSKTLGCNSYTGMFYGCTGLTVAPELPAVELADNDKYRGGCYESMFQGCTSLTAAPVLPASVLTESCYKNMFVGCTKLNAVTSYATDISAKDATQNWLLGVSSTGTFTKFPLMNAWEKGASGIPYGWNIVVDSSQGDLNGDGKVTVTDVGLMIDYINNPSDGFNVKTADLNHDGMVTLIDVMMALDIILNSSDE